MHYFVSKNIVYWLLNFSIEDKITFFCKIMIVVEFNDEEQFVEKLRKFNFRFNFFFSESTIFARKLRIASWKYNVVG